MNFRKVSVLLGLLCFLAVNVATADVLLKDTSELIGTWKLEFVALGLNKPKIEENRIWEFRPDGTVVTQGHNRHFNIKDHYEWKYRIIDGKIAADDPGRPGKTIDYSVYKKEGNELILRGGIEGFYFFKKQ